MTDDNRFWTCWRESTSWDYAVTVAPRKHGDRVREYCYRWAFYIPHHSVTVERAERVLAASTYQPHQASRAVHQPHR